MLHYTERCFHRLYTKIIKIYNNKDRPNINNTSQYKFLRKRDCERTLKNETCSLYLSFIFSFPPSCPFSYHGDSPSYLHPVPEQLSAVQTGLKAAWSVQIPISLTHIIYSIYSIYAVYLFPLMCLCVYVPYQWLCPGE